MTSVPIPLADPHALAVILGGAQLDNADGAIAHWAVEVVSGLIRGYLPGVQLAPVEDVTAVFGGVPGRRLDLGIRPLIAVAAVTVDGEALGVDDFSFRRSGWLLRHGGPGWWNVDAGLSHYADSEISVTFSAGFATVPADLTAVCQSAAARLIANPAQWRSLPAAGAGPEGQLTAAYPAGFTVSELAVLRRYRRRTL